MSNEEPWYEEFDRLFRTLFSSIMGILEPKYTSYSWLITYPIEEETINLQEQIKKILREEYKLPPIIRRRYSQEDIENLIKNVKWYLESGYGKDEAIYGEVRNFIYTNRQDNDLNDNGNEQDYWDSYIKYERPLVDYILLRLNSF